MIYWLASLDELSAAYEELDKDKGDGMETDGVEVLKGQVYSFEELGHADKGIAPHAFKDDVSTLWESNAGDSWDVGCPSLGVSSL